MENSCFCGVVGGELKSSAALSVQALEGGKKKKPKGHTTQTEVLKGPGALSKQETAKMLSKALKVSIYALHVSTFKILPFLSKILSSFCAMFIEIPLLTPNVP